MIDDESLSGTQRTGWAARLGLRGLGFGVACWPWPDDFELAGAGIHTEERFIDQLRALPGGAA